MIRCALCGKLMFNAAITIGKMAVGPKCAKRAGLIENKKRKFSIKKQKTKKEQSDQQTIDLFECLDS